MNNPKKILLCFTIVMLVMFGGVNIVPAQTAEQIAEKALAATVYLEMKDQNGVTLGFGSGFFVKENLIATNYHVIEGAAQGTARLVGKYTTYNIEGITATDKTNDLTLLKVTAYGIKPLPLGDSNNAKTGETVYVAGSQSGLEGTFSRGTISIEFQDVKKWLQIIGTSISPRGSGGPSLNKTGKVIGISISTPSDNLGLGAENGDFAIPVNSLKRLLTNRPRVAKPLSQRRQSISAETYYRWGYAKHKLGDHKNAIENYDMAIQLKPDYALAYYNRGVAKEMLRQYFAATADYNTANNLEPNAAMLRNSMGGFAAALGNYKGAIAHYDMAIRLKPSYAEA
ncbi:tetratricopeptide repeat protein, partial [Candidatus Poribacteria bacterium]|nr:tetratricopeptide repeat protein [Candidatus Poribacteria bacterium]